MKSDDVRPLIGVIENLNYLQCRWAHRAIYSNRRDFAFARRVFRENPQYRTMPKTSLLRFGAEPVPSSSP